MPEIKNIEKLTVECDDCREDSTVCLCESHYDERLKEEYERGRKDGREEADKDNESLIEE